MMLDQRLLCIITGASRGYGRAVACVFAELAAPGSLFLLLGRDQEALEATRAQVLAARPQLAVHWRALDLSSAGEAELLSALAPATDAAAAAAAEGTATAFDAGLLVHNAGSAGEPGRRAASLSERDPVLAYAALNVVSPVTLTGVYLNRLRGSARRHWVVNVSSLLAVRPMASLALYASGKAARDMFFRCLAAEESEAEAGEEAPVRVLNWSPGPMDTDMRKQVAERSFDAGVRALLTPHVGEDSAVQSARKLAAVLVLDAFESGARLNAADV